jgi:hypothetical protein
MFGSRWSLTLYILKCIKMVYAITHVLYSLSSKNSDRKFWSTSGIFLSGIFKEDTDNYRKYLWIYCVYNILNYDALWLLLLLIFCPNIIYFCSVKLNFSISYMESGIKIITINWNIAISCIYEWIKCCQKKGKSIDEWLILLRNIILLRKSQLVSSYTLKLDVSMFLKSGLVNM